MFVIILMLVISGVGNYVDVTDIRLEIILMQLISGIGNYVVVSDVMCL